jgi:hypothetical protein
MSEQQPDKQGDFYNRVPLFEVGLMEYVNRYGIESAQGYLQAFNDCLKEIIEIAYPKGTRNATHHVIGTKIHAFLNEHTQLFEAVQKSQIWNDINPQP